MHHEQHFPAFPAAKHSCFCPGVPLPTHWLIWNTLKWFDQKIVLISLRGVTDLGQASVSKAPYVLHTSKVYYSHIQLRFAWLWKLRICYWWSLSLRVIHLLEIKGLCEYRFINFYHSRNLAIEILTISPPFEKYIKAFCIFEVYDLAWLFLKWL